MKKFQPRLLTVQEVTNYRNDTGAGMIEAKRKIYTDHVIDALVDLRANGTLEDKIEFLLDRYVESLK